MLARCTEEQWVQQLQMREPQTRQRIRTATGSHPQSKSCWIRSSSTSSKNRQSWSLRKCSQRLDRRDRSERSREKQAQHIPQVLQCLPEVKRIERQRLVQ